MERAVFAEEAVVTRRREDLEALRDALLDALSIASPGELASLSRELRAVTSELQGDAEVRGSPLDELAARRAGLADSPGALSAGGGQNRRR